MKKRILLNENEFTANQYIGIAERQHENWNKLESLLVKMGLDAKNIESIDQLNEKLKDKFQFPNASKEFNLESLGFTAYYNQATKILNTNDWSKEKPTSESIEAIKEKHRIYTNSDKQIEAYELCQRMFKDIARAKELGLIVDYHLFDFSENCRVYGYRIKNDILGNMIMKVE
ncbi:hypothetical protein E0I26_08920 [Flavobacterium rhamnosiphilum]|uniref:Uncharacterized protein n=1 Tax=Flavobacterium rhamnosiphilum TaxID=2541724 RepID=A0A4R5F842_9FLAO|nr:hypothetical protein [Flavobacterium rhamnosiphilum]TDE44477.1 hypothetical protein E0I26_08920 [Flavobacterium rhamnosiphilum]